MIKQTNEMKVLRAFVKEFSPFYQCEIREMSYEQLIKEVKSIAKEM